MDNAVGIFVGALADVGTAENVFTDGLVFRRHGSAVDEGSGGRVGGLDTAQRSKVSFAADGGVDHHQAAGGDGVGVAFLLQTADEAHIELGSGEKSAETPGVGEDVGDVFEQFVNDDLTGIVTDVEEVDTGAVLPGEVVKTPVTQIAVADFVVVDTDAHLRKGAVEFFEVAQSTFGGGILISPVDGVGLIVDEEFTGIGADGGVDNIGEVGGSAVLRSVGDAGEAGTADGGTVSALFGNLAVERGNDFVHIGDEFAAGGDHDGLFAGVVRSDVADSGVAVVTQNCRSDKRSDIFRRGIFEFIDLAGEARLRVVHTQTDGTAVAVIRRPEGAAAEDDQHSCLEVGFHHFFFLSYCLFTRRLFISVY